MDCMLDPPDDRPEPTSADIEDARRRVLKKAREDAATLLEQIDHHAVLDLYEALQHDWPPRHTLLGAAASAFVMDIERALFTDEAIDEALSAAANEGRDEERDPDDYMKDEALEWGGRDVP